MPPLRISEIFSSIQGEGIWLGTPSAFVRVSGCNLRCVWCDTPYASWHPEGPVMELEEIVRDIEELNIRHVVITGGEPMLFETIQPLTQSLKAGGFTITIETAGTVFREVECDLMSISPKLSNSCPEGRIDEEWVRRHEHIRKDLEPLKKLVRSYASQLKFVVNPEQDLPSQLIEIERLLSELAVPSPTVLLMAEGADVETLTRREQLLVPACLEAGYRLSPRMHITLFGNTRGT